MCVGGGGGYALYIAHAHAWVHMHTPMHVHVYKYIAPTPLCFLPVPTRATKPSNHPPAPTHSPILPPSTHPVQLGIVRFSPRMTSLTVARPQLRQDTAEERLFQRLEAEVRV